MKKFLFIFVFLIGILTFCSNSSFADVSSGYYCGGLTTNGEARGDNECFESTTGIIPNSIPGGKGDDNPDGTVVLSECKGIDSFYFII